MPSRTARPPRSLLFALAFSACLAGGAEAQLESPAAEAAHAFLEVVRSGDRDALRAFYESRFAPQFLEVAPMERHLQIATSLKRDLVGREMTRLRLMGPHEVSIILLGARDGLEMRLRVEPRPPHRIAGFAVRPAALETGANPAPGGGSALERRAGGPASSGAAVPAQQLRKRADEGGPR